jgi:hypothetical protein
MTQKRVVPIDGSTVSHHAIITLAIRLSCSAVPSCSHWQASSGGCSKFRRSIVSSFGHDRPSDTYRTVYTVEFPEAVYVVDAFQKKSKRGIAPPQEDIDRIDQRIKTLRQERGTSAGKTFIAQLLARHAIRQRIIDEKRKKQHEPK